MNFIEDELAKDLLGKTIIVGFIHHDNQDNLIKREEFFGIVKMASAKEGVLVEMMGTRLGEVFNLPPHHDAFRKAVPNQVYKLKSTGEEVIKPDYLASWLLKEP